MIGNDFTANKNKACFVAQVETLIRQNSSDKLINLLNERLSNDPLDRECLFAVGLFYKSQGLYEKALESILLSDYHEIKPNIYWNEVGECQFNLNREIEASKAFEQSISCKPDFVAPYINLGVTLLKRQKLQDAQAILEKALTLDPENPHVNLYLAFSTFRLTHDALSIENYLDQALKIDNDNLCTALSLAFLNAEVKNDHQKKNKIVNQLLHRFPNSSYTWIYKAHITNEQGDIDTCLEYLEKAVSLNPQDDFAHNKLIMASHYTDKASSEEILKYSQNYYQQYTVPFLKKNPIKFNFDQLFNEYKVNKKLRIGFLSADFKNHPVFFWVSSLLKYQQNNDYEIYCYANNLENRFAASLQCSKLEYVLNYSDIELAHKIHHDKIHVLVDLSGHTAGNRLNTFALKPAPLQATWLGHLGPQGLPEIDYFLTDEYYVKDGEEKLFTEKIHKIPVSAYPYPADDYSNLPYNQSLARTDGSIVLGSINHVRKINDAVLNSWAQVMQIVDNSLLTLNNSSTPNSNYKERILKIFNNYGINDSRIIFKAPSNKVSYFQNFSDFDIALDPFPYGGGTTTHETLMMSVPLIALRGNKIASRMSPSILDLAGFSELIANSKEEYIKKLVKLAQDPQQIIYYKKNIRKQYLNSAATDMKSFTPKYFQTLKELFESTYFKSSLN